MTSPLPIIVDSEDRGMKRPVEEVARAIYTQRNGYGCTPWNRQSAAHKLPYLMDAKAALVHMVRLGFLNDNYFVARRAEKAWDEVRKPQ